MPIARLIFIKVDPERSDEALQIWKQKCAPLMISAAGCLREELLRSTDDRSELISYSEWASVADIERYRESEEHHRIKEHSAPMSAGEPPVVRLYEVAG